MAVAKSLDELAPTFADPKRCSIPRTPGWECVKPDGHDGVCGCVATEVLDLDLDPELTAKLEVAEARCESLACSLRSLLAYLRRVDGYVPNDVQWQIRDAEALLVSLEGT